jgi:two-component system sensor histidine kinase DesK
VAGSDPARARAELAELIVLADRSRAEANAVAEDEPALVLREEADAARVALAAAGARVRMDPERWPTAPPAVDAVLAAVLREAVTNVLRHSRARRCHIAVTVHKGIFRLTVGNDGAAKQGEAGLGKGLGRGLANLTARATAVGGCLSAGADGYGWFALVAEIPASTEDASARDCPLLRESLIA